MNRPYQEMQYKPPSSYGLAQHIPTWYSFSSKYRWPLGLRFGHQSNVKKRLVYQTWVCSLARAGARRRCAYCATAEEIYRSSRSSCDRGTTVAMTPFLLDCEHSQHHEACSTRSDSFGRSKKKRRLLPSPSTSSSAQQEVGKTQHMKIPQR